ncbi:hypothetical protein ACFWR9_11755 [Streptomyces sp. NPDC058534]|uniref:hypothetical protein n=1 Tax=Streptomyces sp. NPDC058534 TaxID=3346541 RepID=UPI003659AC4D
MSALVRDMVQSLTGLRAGEAQRSGAAVIELNSVALEAQLHDVRPASDDVLRGRILGYIEARLSDQDLTPANVAAAHHISLRRPHRLFEEPCTDTQRPHRMYGAWNRVDARRATSCSLL